MTCKRVMDVLLSLLSLLVAAPIMMIIALCVWLESPGSVIFAQKRVGVRGKLFDLYKFRKFPLHWRNEGPGVTVARDIRMTRVGAFLERTKLDELPQFWNVLKGDMSFVGARPESTKFADLFTGPYAEILQHPPGIFGPTQVAFTDETRLYPPDEDPEAFYRRNLFLQKAKLDLEYLGRANCRSDLKWIAQGIKASLLCGLDLRRFLESSGSVLVIIDLLLIEVGWVLAHVLCFLGLPRDADSQAFMAGFWIFPLTLIFTMALGGCYRLLGQYFTLVDMVRLTQVVSVAWLLGFLLTSVYSKYIASLYVTFIGWLVLLPLLLAPRVWLRIQHERAMASYEGQLRKALIYGAGMGGIALAIWMKQRRNGRELIGFLDDDPKLSGKQIVGYGILGFKRDLPTIDEKYNLDELWVTFEPRALERERLQVLCQRHGIKLVVVADLEPFSPIILSNKAPEALEAPERERRRYAG
jgi:lipopolysaccharide/colanic/teichoic acid biosynthesis glycosyltransferase